jgi:hypothetical protein
MVYAGYAGGLSVGSRLMFVSGSTVPTGLSVDTVYWVVAIDGTVADGNTIYLSLSETDGGAAITGFPVTASVTSPKLIAPGTPDAGFDVSVPTTTYLAHSSFGVYAGLMDVGNRVSFSATGTLPSPLVAETDYWIASSSSGLLSISETDGGSPVEFDLGGVESTAKIFLSLPQDSESALQKITALDADPTTGNWTAVAFAFLDKVVRTFETLATADKPARFTCSKNTTGGENVMVRSYTFSMNLTPLDPATETILDE